MPFNGKRAKVSSPYSYYGRVAADLPEEPVALLTYRATSLNSGAEAGIIWILTSRFRECILDIAATAKVSLRIKLHLGGTRRNQQPRLMSTGGPRFEYEERWSRAL